MDNSEMMQQQDFTIDRNKAIWLFLAIVRGQSWAYLTSMETQEAAHFPISCLHKDLSPKLRLEKHSERKEGIMLDRQNLQDLCVPWSFKQSRYHEWQKWRLRPKDYVKGWQTGRTPYKWDSTINLRKKPGNWGQLWSECQKTEQKTREFLWTT